MGRYTPGRADLEAALDRYRVLFDDIAADWDGFLGALLRPLPTCVWSNPLRLDGEGLAALIADESLPPGHAAPEPIGWRSDPALGTAFRLPPGFKAGQHWWYCAGLAHAQEEVSQLPVTLMDLTPGQRVLDLCAAPGGKTAQIALALGNRGTLLANDFSPERIAALQGNLDRLGIVNCSTTWCDGGNYPAAAGQFDRILVDAPCSSEGTLRRNRSLVVKLGEDRSERMLRRQRTLLRKALQLCRPGGRVVYSTCTFAPEENECIVAEALEAAGGRFRLLPIRVEGLTTSPGVTRWQGRTLDPSLARCLRLWPHVNDTGGFFVAVLEKEGAGDGMTETGPDIESQRGSQAGAVPVADLQPDVDDDRGLALLAEHYGLPECLWAQYRVHRQTRRGLHLAAADHLPPAVPKAQGSGLFFHRTNIRPPKLTTGGALLLGASATRRFIDVDADQRDAYLRRQPQTPNPAQVRDCRPGHVLVRYRGFVLGVAVLHRSGTLESLFPSRWSGCTAG
jgi:NOL1/NOP2/sun family putative RNA methylase